MVNAGPVSGSGSTLAHRAALATEQGYAMNGDVQELKSVAASAVPIISEHLRMADQLTAKSGVD